jgi:DNA repair protein SbcC/Rad50
MNPLSLTATAYRTYPDLTLTFPDGVCAITGELVGEPGKSNGSGKSSVANAIDLALFGAQSRSLADEHNPAFGDTMMLELVFGHGINEYRVRRTYSAKGRGSTTVDLEEGDGGESETGGWLTSSEWRSLSRESAAATQAHLEQILGLTRPTFRASSFLAQGDGAAFTNAQPRERKRILAEVLGLQVWDGLLEKARAEKRATDLRLADVAGMIDRAAPELEQQDGLVLKRDQARENEQTAHASLAEATSRLATARDALAEARGLGESRAGAEKALQQADFYLSELQRGLAAREESLHALDARLETRPALKRAAGKLETLEAEREALRQAIAQWDERQRLIAERTRLFDETADLVARADSLAAKAVAVAETASREVCELCDRPLDTASARAVVASYRRQAEELDDPIREKAEACDALKPQIDALPSEEPSGERWLANGEEISEAQRARTQLAALDEAQARRDDLHTEIQKMRAGLPEREAAVGDARAELEALGPHDPRAVMVAQHLFEKAEVDADTARYSMTKHATEIARLEERLARLDALAGDVHLATQERDQLRDEQELLTALERAYGPNGIPAFIVENTAIPSIETEACRILLDLGTEYQVELHTQRETKSGSVADALDIVVYDGTRARPYEGFSGGEKTRIELALRIALAHLLANRRGAESRVLVIDEPDGLDSAGMAALAEVLRRLHADGLFEKILLVSHVAELRDAFEASIHVVCENGVSRVYGAREMVTA